MAYKIKAGDTLSALAKKWGVSVADIMAANPQITDANKISAGATLTQPGSSSSSSSSSKTGTDVLNNPNATLAEIINEIRTATGSAEDKYTRPELLELTAPTLRGIGDLTDLLGMGYTYDRGEIEAILNAATDASYEVRKQEQDNAQRDYYRNMAREQETAIDTIRQQEAQAVSLGVAQGMRNSNLLSTILGTSQIQNDAANQLAQEQSLAAKEYAAERAANVASALDRSNEAFINVGGLSRQLYADDVNKWAADTSYNASLEDTYAQYLANKYSSDSQLLGNIAQAGGGVYNTNQSSLAEIEAAMQAAAAQRYYADKQYAGMLAQANASRSSGGGSGGSSGNRVEVPQVSTTPKASANYGNDSVTAQARAAATARTAAIRAATKQPAVKTPAKATNNSYYQDFLKGYY